MLYSPHDFFGWATAVKTWCRQAVHVEIYDGGFMSLASRNGIGVNLYGLRTFGLTAVRRPRIWLNTTPWLSHDWFGKVRGQKYDWAGLLCFTLAVHQGALDKQFCSEFACRQYREWGAELFNPEIDADTVAPSEFWQAGTLATVWEKAK